MGTADGLGRYAVTGLVPGDYCVRAAALGYTAHKDLQGEILPNSAITLDVPQRFPVAGTG